MITKNQTVSGQCHAHAHGHGRDRVSDCQIEIGDVWKTDAALELDTDSEDSNTWGLHA